MRKSYRLAVSVCLVVFSSVAVAQQKPDLTILELAGGTSLKLDNVRVAGVTIPLTIEAKEKIARPSTFRLTAFTNGAGQVFVPKVDPTAIPALAKGAQHKLTIHASFPAEGTYRAAMNILMPDGSVSNAATIDVKRARAALPVEIPQLNGAALDALPLETLTANVRTTIYPKGESVEVTPLLHLIVHKPKMDSTSGIRAHEVKMELEGGTNTIVVPAGKPTPVNLQFSGLKRPGRYDATIRFVTPDWSSESRDVSIYVRESWLTAVAYIALGIIAALLLRSYSSTIRPRLLLKRRVATIDQHFEKLKNDARSDDASLRLIARIRRNLRARWEALRLAGKLLGSADFDIYDSILAAAQLFVAIRLALRNVPEPIRVEFEKKLAALETALSDPSIDDAIVKAQATALTAIWRDVPRVPDLHKKIHAAIAEVERDKRPQLDPVRAALKEARTALEALKLDDAESALRKAGAAYSLAIVTLLEKAVTGDAPAGIQRPEWMALKDAIANASETIRNTTDAGLAKKIADDALDNYLQAMIEALTREVEKKLADPKNSDAFKLISELLEETRTLAAKKEPIQAWSRLDEAVKQYVAAAQKSLAGKSMGPAPAVPALDALKAAAGGATKAEAFDITVVIGRDPTAEEVFREGAAGSAERALGFWDFVAAAGILVVASLIGLQILWLDNLAWGGWRGYLGAFLWGFAFDQFTHVGVLGLLPKKS